MIDTLKQESYSREARFELHKAFAMYGQGALLLCLHLGVLTDKEFFDRYKTTKEIVHERMAELEMAVMSGDYVRRNELFDFFIEVL